MMTEQAANVLVVDDDSNLCKILSDTLELKGFRPKGFTQGKPAIVWAEQERPAVALIDLRLEDLPGLEVMGAIKTASPRTECIVLTGQASVASAIEAINLGAYSYLRKPFDIDQIVVTIQRAVEKHETARAFIDSEKRFQAFMENFPGLAYIKDNDGRVVFANEGFTRYLDLNPIDVLGKTDHDLFPAEFAAKVEADDRRMWESGSIQTIEVTTQASAELPIEIGGSDQKRGETRSGSMCTATRFNEFLLPATRFNARRPGG
jgi:PAS domain S-box-containing protein